MSCYKIKNGIKVKLVKVRAEDRKQLWTAAVSTQSPEGGGEPVENIKFYKDTMVTFSNNPYRSTQGLRVYANGTGDGELVGAINVIVQNGVIQGHNPKTEVLAVSRADINAGDVILKKGIEWLYKAEAESMIKAQSEPSFFKKLMKKKPAATPTAALAAAASGVSANPVAAPVPVTVTAPVSVVTPSLSASQTTSVPTPLLVASSSATGTRPAAATESVGTTLDQGQIDSIRAHIKQLVENLGNPAIVAMLDSKQPQYLNNLLTSKEKVLIQKKSMVYEIFKQSIDLLQEIESLLQTHQTAYQETLALVKRATAGLQAIDSPYQKGFSGQALSLPINENLLNVKDAIDELSDKFEAELAAQPESRE